MSFRSLLSTTSVRQQNVEFCDQKKECLQQNPTHALMFNEDMEMDAAAAAWKQMKKGCLRACESDFVCVVLLVRQRECK